MATSVVNLLQSSHIDNSDELTTMLESLPSYESLQENQDESAIFEDDNESLLSLYLVLCLSTKSSFSEMLLRAVSTAASRLSTAVNRVLRGPRTSCIFSSNGLSAPENV
jgi:hypothetical protein